MIKTIHIILASVFFLLSLTRVVHAQTEVLMEKKVTQQVTQTSEPLNYALPYPGILSDHPLYFLKKFRDGIMRIFLNNPVKKIEFSLLQSNKYLAMGMEFAQTGKWDKAGQVIAESQKEMEQAVREVVAARATGIAVPSHIITSMELSTVKHKQIIDGMKIQSQEKEDGSFAKASAEFARLTAEVIALREVQ